MKELPIITHHLTSNMDNNKTPIPPSTPIQEMIFGFAFLAAFGILQLPNEKIEGNPVPTILFKNKPSFFHAFLLSLNFAFTGAVITISLREKYPKIARYSAILLFCP